VQEFLENEHAVFIHAHEDATDELERDFQTAATVFMNRGNHTAELDNDGNHASIVFASSDARGEFALVMLGSRLFTVENPRSHAPSLPVLSHEELWMRRRAAMLMQIRHPDSASGGSGSSSDGDSNHDDNVLQSLNAIWDRVQHMSRSTDAEDEMDTGSPSTTSVLRLTVADTINHHNTMHTEAPSPSSGGERSHSHEGDLTAGSSAPGEEMAVSGPMMEESHAHQVDGCSRDSSSSTLFPAAELVVYIWKMRNNNWVIETLEYVLLPGSEQEGSGSTSCEFLEMGPEQVC
jgi:hypothetical protein